MHSKADQRKRFTEHLENKFKRGFGLQFLPSVKLAFWLSLQGVQRCTWWAAGEPVPGYLSLCTGVVSWHVEIMAALVPGELRGNIGGKENGKKALCTLLFLSKTLHSQKHDLSSELSIYMWFSRTLHTDLLWGQLEEHGTNLKFWIIDCVCEESDGFIGSF